jgi:PhnB protein
MAPPASPPASAPAQGIIPHIVVDNANAAIAFYTKALGAREQFRMKEEKGDRLMHAELEINGARLFLRDDFPEACPDASAGGKPVGRQTPTALGGTSVTLHLDVPNCDAAVDRAVTAGARVVMKPWDAFWGARYAMVVDPYGHNWSFAHPLPAKG